MAEESISEHDDAPNVLSLAQLAEQLAYDSDVSPLKLLRPSRVKTIVSGVKGYTRGPSSSKEARVDRTSNLEGCARLTSRADVLLLCTSS
eukprot:scaffold15779_cov31-Tisochrysis_lutea.AAC.1